MTDLVPIPHLGGSLAPFEGTDRDVIDVTGFPALQAVTLNVQNPPTDVAGTIVEVRGSDAAVLATVTIPQGQRSASWSGSEVPAAGTCVYRITAEGGATELSGRLQFSADLALTTLDRVKSHRGITATANDADLLLLIAAVTKRMQNYIGREIVAGSEAAEDQTPGGWSAYMLTRHFPIVSVTSITIGGSVLPSAEYRVDNGAGTLVRTTEVDGPEIAWSPTRTLTAYSHGYASIPEDLAHAATEEVGHAFSQAKPGGDRLGDEAQSGDTGGTVGYVEAGFLPQTVATMELYRELRA